MLITKEELLKTKVSGDTIKWADRNQLLPFDSEKLVFIVGEYNYFLAACLDVKLGRNILTRDRNKKDPRKTYDDQGNALTFTNKFGYKWVREYDGHGNILKEMDNEGHSTINSYDERGNLIKREEYDSEENVPWHTREFINSYYPNGQLRSIQSGDKLIIFLPLLEKA